MLRNNWHHSSERLQNWSVFSVTNGSLNFFLLKLDHFNVTTKSKIICKVKKALKPKNRVRVFCEDDGDDGDDGVEVNLIGHISVVYPL
jgi:hypothetical protein